MCVDECEAVKTSVQACVSWQCDYIYNETITSVNFYIIVFIL